MNLAPARRSGHGTIDDMSAKSLVSPVGIVMGVAMAVCAGCSSGSNTPATTEAAKPPAAVPADRKYLLERVDDAAVVQLYADGFDALPLREKTLIWHLYQAALAGRDIYYDQRYEHNLAMRDVLEEIITHPEDVDPQTLSRDPALHEALLDQHRALQQPHRAQVRPEVHARGLRGRCRRRAEGRRDSSRSSRAKRSTRCSSVFSRCSST